MVEVFATTDRVEMVGTGKGASCDTTHLLP